MSLLRHYDRVRICRNQAPFRELAERVPLTALASLVQNESEVEKSLVRLQALLLGMAGFLPSQRPECEHSPFEDYAYISKLELAWEKMQLIDVMGNNAWQSFRVRPTIPLYAASLGCASCSVDTRQRVSYPDCWN